MDVDIQAGGSPEQVAADQAEAAKIEQARGELLDEATGGGELLLGKYKDVDALAEGYKNLQREIEKLKGNAPSEPTPEATPEPVQQEQVAPEPQTAELSAEEQRNVDDIMEAVMSQVGSAEKYQQLGTWAKSNLDESRLNAYNNAVNSGDKGQILTALKSLQYDYMMSTGYEPRLTGGRAAPQEETKGFSSRYEMTLAMSDPRYQKDDAYRKEVEKRMAVTPNSFFGFKD